MSTGNISIGQARSFLFVPADRLDRLQKALDSQAHAVIVDLEDAVAPQKKASARSSFLQAWGQLDHLARARTMVRINAPASRWHEEDLDLIEQLAKGNLPAVMVAKAESVAPLTAVACRAPSAVILPLIESAAGLRALDLLARAPGVSRFAFGHLDLQADLVLHCDGAESALDPLRLTIVIASRLAGLSPPVDGVTASIQEPARTIEDAQRSRRLGFGGKLCIHPKQVPIVNDTLGPSEAELGRARSVLEARETRDAGAFELDGQMIDEPVLRRARSLFGARVNRR